MRRSISIRLDMMEKFLNISIMFFCSQLISVTLLNMGLPYLIDDLWICDLLSSVFAETCQLGCLFSLYYELRSKDNGRYFTLPVIDMRNQISRVAALVHASMV
jgi:hypothetical protein